MESQHPSYLQPAKHTTTQLGVAALDAFSLRPRDEELGAASIVIRNFCLGLAENCARRYLSEDTISKKSSRSSERWLKASTFKCDASLHDWSRCAYVKRLNISWRSEEGTENKEVAAEMDDMIWFSRSWLMHFRVCHLAYGTQDHNYLVFACQFHFCRWN